MKNYPNTYQDVTTNSVGTERPELFDPSLKQFARAFRLGDPKIPNPKLRYEWYKARRQVIDHILTLVHRSVWREHLVLRGSLLLKAWLGDSAREPGDIDWVFRRTEVAIGDVLAQRFFRELIQLVSDSPYIEYATIDVRRITTDDIWTYERASGRRIVFPWKVEGMPGGEVQMDIVFAEALFANPIETPIPLINGNSLLIWSASKELSLAWKLLWLETDMHPQGKDLYDAALLAEQSSLPLGLLRQVLEHSDEWHSQRKFSANSPFDWYVDWDNFKAEYAWIEGDVKEWQNRLSVALSPTFDNPVSPQDQAR
jgi:hypothetical protein